MSEDDLYQRLFRGEVEAIHVYVDSLGTRAHDKPSGVYALTADEFRQICSRIAMDRLKDGWTGEGVAKLTDENGMGNRWFRLSDAVVEWLRSKEPVVKVEGHIG